MNFSIINIHIVNIISINNNIYVVGWLGMGHWDGRLWAVCKVWKVALANNIVCFLIQVLKSRRMKFMREHEFGLEHIFGTSCFRLQR